MKINTSTSNKNNLNITISILIKEALLTSIVKNRNSLTILKLSLSIKMSTLTLQILFKNCPRNHKNNLTQIFPCLPNIKTCSVIFFPPLNMNLSILSKTTKFIFKFPKNPSSNSILLKC